MITEVLNKLKNTTDYEEGGQVLTYIGNVIKDSKKLSSEDLKEVMRFAIDEMKRLMSLIPSEKSYKKKDEIFFYEDKLLMVYTLADVKTKNTLGTKADLEVIKQLVNLVSEERTVENAVDELFELKSIDKVAVDKTLDLVKAIDDEYRRGKFFQGLNEYKDKIKTCSQDAKSALADYTTTEIERLLNIAQSNEYALNCLEYIVDVCKYFINDLLLQQLQKIMVLKSNNVRYYALETLLVNKCDIQSSVIRELAEDDEYAELTHALLIKHGKTNLFPKELDNAEYLAKSDMVHWLVYPTELGKKPDDIQLLGRVEIKKDTYFIFKYKSNSDNLSQDLINQWLIGWTEYDGASFSSFSEFDKLSDYEGKDIKKTLKRIAKKLK